MTEIFRINADSYVLWKEQYITSSLVNSFWSLGVYWAKPSAMLVRGTMVTFSKASVVGNSQPTMAWPASWYATTRFSAGDIALLRFSVPPTTRSTAYSRSAPATIVCLARAACSAASLQTLAMSAPAHPLLNQLTTHFQGHLVQGNLWFKYLQ